MAAGLASESKNGQLPYGRIPPESGTVALLQGSSIQPPSGF